MKHLAILLLLAGVASANQDKTRAERSYFAALMIVEKADGAKKPEVRHKLLGRAAPVLRAAENSLRIARGNGADVARLAERVRALRVRITTVRNRRAASTDANARPTIPNTGTVVIVSREEDAPAGEVVPLGPAPHRLRVQRRAMLNEWRIQRTLMRVGTRAMDKQATRLGQLQALRAEHVTRPTNLGRVIRRAELNQWRAARVESRVGWRVR
ncbi:MAG: hypothetical protein AAGD14_05240 [Planctomycetota bacterium]